MSKRRKKLAPKAWKRACFKFHWWLNQEALRVF